MPSVLVGLLVFAEDALFVGFVLPGETAAVLGGVDTSRHPVHLSLMIIIVVAVAILGGSVGYQISRHFGPCILSFGVLRRHSRRLDDAGDLLARRGGPAVFVGRFAAFFHAVLPTLSGTADMRYLTFLAFNAAGGLVWGIGFVVLGFLAGDSYKTVEKTIGRDAAIVVPHSSSERLWLSGSTPAGTTPARGRRLHAFARSDTCPGHRSPSPP